MANFPTSVSTDANLYIAVNGIQTALASPALISDVILTLVSTTSFPMTGAVTVDQNEVVFYTGVSGNTITGCTRGADGTVPLPHNAGAIVGLTVVAAHHNLLKDEIEAIETALGAGYTRTLENLSDVVVSSPSAGQVLEWNGTDWVNASAPAITQLTGDVTAGPGSGSQSATVVSVGGATSTEVGYTHGVTSPIQTQINNIPSVFLGAVIESSTATPPNSSFVLANGQAISRTTHSAYFSLVGTTFGPGDGSTTFNVPNRTDRVAIGAGNLYTLGQTGGSTTHTLVDAEMAATAVTVNVTDPSHGHNILGNSVNSADNSITLAGTGSVSIDAGSTHPGTPQYRSVSLANSLPWIQASATGITATGTVNGSATPFSVLPPFIGMYYMVRVL